MGSEQEDTIADVIVSLGPVTTTIAHQAMVTVDIEDAIAEWANSLHRPEGGPNLPKDGRPEK